MNGKVRSALIVILSCALVFFVVQTVRSYREETAGEAIYEEAVDEFLVMSPKATDPTEPATTAPASTSAGETEPETTAAATTGSAVSSRPVIMNAEEVTVDFAKLLAVNPEVVGWIVVENTTISYPVLHGEDNTKYLTTTYNNRYSKYGSIYIDYRLESTFDIDHTVIYGHNMRNSSMFGTLLKFSTQSYYNSRKYFHIITPEGMLKYEIFSAYTASVGSETYYAFFYSDSQIQEFLDAIVGYSDISTGVVPQVGDKIVTLSTCTSVSDERNEKRYVVHGRLISDTRPGHGGTETE